MWWRVKFGGEPHQTSEDGEDHTSETSGTNSNKHRPINSNKYRYGNNDHQSLNLYSDNLYCTII